MAGQPRTRAIVDAQVAALREVHGWYNEQKALLDERADLTPREREQAEHLLLVENAERSLKAMTAARRKVKREMSPVGQIRAQLAAEEAERMRQWRETR